MENFELKKNKYNNLHLNFIQRHRQNFIDEAPGETDSKEYIESWNRKISLFKKIDECCDELILERPDLLERIQQVKNGKLRDDEVFGMILEKMKALGFTEKELTV
jgi:hypothetical protein